MNIVVLATASRVGGALTIYKQFLNHLRNEKGTDNYYIMVNKTMPMPEMDNVIYIVVDTTSILSRLFFDFYQGGKLLKVNGILPKVLVSLQNTGLFRSGLPQVIYYHQSIPLYPQKWSLLKKEERILFYYKYIYPFFVNITRNKKTHYVVQIPFIKKGMVEKFHVPANRAHTMFPDIEDIDVRAIRPYNWDDERTHFLYPANGSSYKMHVTLINAFRTLKNKKIRLHLTISKGEYPIIDNQIEEAGLEEIIIREGAMSHQQLLSMYKASSGLLFPSMIETIGLPMLEAAAFGIPVIAADVDYAHQVLCGYEGASFVNAFDVKGWVDNIQKIKDNPQRFKPMKKRGSSWPDFFELIRNCANI